MNVYLLMRALRDGLTGPLASLPLACAPRQSVAKKGESDASLTARAKIHLGHMPAKNLPAAGYEVPFVLIQALGGHESSDGFARAVIALRVCVWNDDPEGSENDLHNLLATLRHAVLPFRSAALEGRYILESDESGAFAPWTRPDEQAANFAEAYVLTNWKMQGLG